MSLQNFLNGVKAVSKAVANNAGACRAIYNLQMQKGEYLLEDMILNANRINNFFESKSATAESIVKFLAPSFTRVKRSQENKRKVLNHFLSSPFFQEYKPEVYINHDDVFTAELTHDHGITLIKVEGCMMSVYNYDLTDLCDDRDDVPCNLVTNDFKEMVEKCYELLNAKPKKENSVA